MHCWLEHFNFIFRNVHFLKYFGIQVSNSSLKSLKYLQDRSILNSSYHHVPCSFVIFSLQGVGNLGCRVQLHSAVKVEELCKTNLCEHNYIKILFLKSFSLLRRSL